MIDGLATNHNLNILYYLFQYINVVKTYFFEAVIFERGEGLGDFEVILTHNNSKN